MGFIQLRCLPHAVQLILGKYDNPNESGQITHFQALSAALSGTIGLGNIAGVAIAISMGGPGSILWMWVVGFLGMATKFVECSLGTYFRHIDPKTGNVYGGPMFYIKKGLGKRWNWLSVIYCICIIFAGFGSACMFQSNQAASALFQFYDIPVWMTGLVLMTITGLVILGGIKRIGIVASKIVPTMCLIYVFGALLICLLNSHLLGQAFSVIITDAFTGEAVAGAGLGTVIIWGVRRAIFSNEAGLGSAAIAHAAVKTNYPIREGFVAALGPLIDTLIVCTSTALVIVLSGYYGSGKFISQGNVYSFENNNKISISSSSLPIDSINDLNMESSQYIDGSYVLTLKNNTSLEPIIIGPFDTNHEAIRFSYKAIKGDLEINLLDINKNKIGAIFNNKSFCDLTVSDQQYLSSKYPFKSDEWAHAVFSFTHQFKNKINFEKFYLHINPKSSDTLWYFDNFSSVETFSGITLTSFAFDKFLYGFGSIFITISVFFFAFSTMITWSYYGETALFYLFKGSGIILYKIIFVFLAFYGSIITLKDVINFSDLMIGLLVIPNVIAIFLLLPVVKNLTLDYFTDLKSGKIKPYK